MKIKIDRINLDTDKAARLRAGIIDLVCELGYYLTRFDIDTSETDDGMPSISVTIWCNQLTDPTKQ